MKKSALCTHCHLDRSGAPCPICQEHVCRSCEVRVNPEELLWGGEATDPENLPPTRYCPACHESHFLSAVEQREATLALARELPWWSHDYRGRIPRHSRAHETLQIENGTDREETLLRLAYEAVKKGFTGIVEVRLESKKVRHGNSRGYQTMRWQGSAVPVKLDAPLVERSLLD